MKYIHQFLTLFLLLTTLVLTGCQTSAPTTSSETTERTSLAPDRVDIRGSIVMKRYSEGQVVLEVESFSASPNTRFERAYVLVLPTTQIITPDGKSMSLFELQQGQQVAILLRGGGKGSLVGVGVARKMWLENTF